MLGLVTLLTSRYGMTQSSPLGYKEDVIALNVNLLYYPLRAHIFRPTNKRGRTNTSIKFSIWYTNFPLNTPVSFQKTCEATGLDLKSLTFPEWAVQRVFQVCYLFTKIIFVVMQNHIFIFDNHLRFSSSDVFI